MKQQRHRPKTGICAFFFVPLWFAKEIFDDLHLTWREPALVFLVARIPERLQKAAGFGYLLSEGSYGRLVCPSGIIPHGQVAKLATAPALWPRPCSCGFLCCKSGGLLFSVTNCHVSRFKL